MRNTVVDHITRLAQKNKDIFFVSGDAGFGVLETFQKNFPKRFLNLGIAEQNMIGFSAGLSLSGYKVFIYNIIPFLLYRCYEQVRNDICYQRLPVVLIGIGSGVTYAPQGVTHYSVEDLALAKTLPNLTVCSPADPYEARLCAQFAAASKTPVYIRLAKKGEANIHAVAPQSIEEPIVLQEGKGIAVLFHGSISDDVVKAAQELPGIKFISVPMVQPLNVAALGKALENIETIITVEEHYVIGGLGSTVADWIVDEELPFKLQKLGIKHSFIHEIKDRDGMRTFFGIDAASIVKAVRKAVK